MTQPQHPKEMNVRWTDLLDFEKAMDEFIADALDPEYIIRERLHIEIESLCTSTKEANR